MIGLELYTSYRNIACGNDDHICNIQLTRSHFQIVYALIKENFWQILFPRVLRPPGKVALWPLLEDGKWQAVSIRAAEAERRSGCLIISRGRERGLKPHRYRAECGLVKNLSSDRPQDAGYEYNCRRR